MKFFELMTSSAELQDAIHYLHHTVIKVQLSWLSIGQPSYLPAIVCVGDRIHVRRRYFSHLYPDLKFKNIYNAAW
jgi:hypothetical protein